MNRFICSWAILPATRCLFNKNKVCLADMSKDWKEGTLIVTARKANYGDKHQTIMFIHGYGHSDYGVKVGDTQDAHHDQTCARFSPMKIINIVHWKLVNDENGGSKVEIVWSAEPFDINMKAPLSVFK